MFVACCDNIKSGRGDTMEKFEKFLRKIKDSQDFSRNDRLSKIISKYDDDELSLDELDNISAASKPDFYFSESDNDD